MKWCTHTLSSFATYLFAAETSSFETFQQSLFSFKKGKSEHYLVDELHCICRRPASGQISSSEGWCTDQAQLMKQPGYG